MHELSRVAYLEAMGVDNYVSRQQLPGAAVTERLAILRKSPAVPADSVPPVELQAARSLASIDLPAARPTAAQPQQVVVPESCSADAIRLNLFAVAAGECLWVESLGGAPLASEQVILIRSMAHAIAIARGETVGFNPAERPDIAQFKWPMHNNAQLDNSAEAAKSGLTAFLSRRMEGHGCQTLVILGRNSAQWVAGDTIAQRVIVTSSTAEMVANPGLKSGVWQDLKPLYSNR